MRPDVAQALDRMAAAARGEAGILLLVTSGFRSDAEQARLFAARPAPSFVFRSAELRSGAPRSLDVGTTSPAARRRRRAPPGRAQPRPRQGGNRARRSSTVRETARGPTSEITRALEASGGTPSASNVLSSSRSSRGLPPVAS